MEDDNLVGRVEYLQLLVWVIVLAIPASLLTLVYLKLYEWGIEAHQHLSGTLVVAPALFIILVAVLGGLLVGYGLRYQGERHDQSFHQQMAEGKVPYRGLVGSLIISLVGLVCGASVGPEGPVGHAGAGLGSWLADKLQYPKEKARILSLSGLSAAFGGFLGTPMSAAFMSLEFTKMLSFPIYANLIATTLSAVIGAWLVFGLTGDLPAGSQGYPQSGLLNISSFLYAIFFGLIGLGWAFLFKVIFGGTRRLAGKLDRYPVLKPAAGGLAFGLLGAILPLTLFSGEHELAYVLTHGVEIGISMLILLAVVKLLTLSICLATGFPGGFVFPLFFSAGSLGYAIHLLLPFIPLPVCVVGMMAGIGGAVMRMPFTTVLFLLILGNPKLLPVSVLAAVTSYLSATILEAGSARKAMRQSVAGRRETYSAS